MGLPLKIIIDTQEKKIEHITKYFDAREIPYTFKKLSTGDYTAEIDGEVISCVIERKNSISELCGNLGTWRERFSREFERGKNTQIILMIEEDNYEKLVTGNYSSKMNPKALLASLLTFEFRYNIHVYFVPRRFSGQFIYYSLLYFYKNSLNKKKRSD